MMKKYFIVIFFIVSSVFSFAEKQECDFEDVPNSYERAIISKIKKNNLTDKIYCDSGNQKMVYTTGGGSNFDMAMQIGIYIDTSKMKGANFDAVWKEYTRIIKLLTPDYEFSMGTDTPNAYKYRLYIDYTNTDTNEKYYMMLFNIVYNLTDNEWEYFLNVNLKEDEFYDEFMIHNDNFFYTKDVLY